MNEDIFSIRRKNLKQTIEEIEQYVNAEFHAGNEKKVFYHYNEWSGWRFWRKAIKHRDYRSMLGHIGIRV